MILRSLRWRLLIAMTLIIALALVAAGIFSSLTVKREFNRFLVAEKRNDVRAAADILGAAGPSGLRDALARIHAQFGIRSIVADEQGRITMRYPAEMDSYQIKIGRDGVLRLERRARGGFESLMLQTQAINIRGVGSVYLLPPRERAANRGNAFRISVDRWLIIGLATAVLLVLLVMLTIFRRVFAPVEALTGGARALAGGRLDTRVDVRGRDEIAELAGAFNTMAEALERNEKARRNMVNDVAHELRTPLTNIRAQIEAVQDGVMQPDAKWVASIEEDAALLARLVDDLQQLSLAEAGQLRLELAEVEVAELVERALTGLDTRGLTVTREIAPMVLRVDTRRMVQVLRNLIVNAITYAKSAIHISASRGEIRVADDGPGVPAEHAERIFDRFYRADPSRSRTTGGAGLGLAIARELVELHGGTIRYEKPAFVITLPPSS